MKPDKCPSSAVVLGRTVIYICGNFLNALCCRHCSFQRDGHGWNPRILLYWQDGQLVCPNCHRRPQYRDEIDAYTVCNFEDGGDGTFRIRWAAYKASERPGEIVRIKARPKAQALQQRAEARKGAEA